MHTWRSPVLYRSGVDVFITVRVLRYVAQVRWVIGDPVLRQSTSTNAARLSRFCVPQRRLASQLSTSLDIQSTPSYKTLRASIALSQNGVARCIIVEQKLVAPPCSTKNTHRLNAKEEKLYTGKRFAVG